MRRLLALLLLVTACQASRPDWPVAAARTHAEADRLIDGGDRAGARAVLEQLIATLPPGGNPAARRMVLQDTYFRLARLALDAHDPASAARHAEEGLALGDSGDLFTANLLVVRGAAHEAVGENAAALAAYQRALRINEALLHDTLRSP